MRPDQQPAEWNHSALLRAVQGRDDEALAELLATCARIVQPIIKAKVPPCDAEDVVQDVLVAAYLGVSVLDRADARKLRGWLSVLARHKVADYHRRRKEVASDAMVRMPDPRAAAQLSRVEDRETLGDSLKALTPRQLLVVSLRLVWQLPFGDIGRRLAISDNAADAIYRRAIMKLQRKHRRFPGPLSDLWEVSRRLTIGPIARDPPAARARSRRHANTTD
jgi:RNA polymerase sigma factor (sigma-70 family)